MTAPFLSEKPFSPRDIAGLGLWLQHDLGVATTVAAFAGTGTVAVTANVGTFSASQDGTLTPSAGDIVTVGAQAYTVGARTDATHWAVTGPDVAASAFTITKYAPRITGWADQSGFGRDFAQATAAAQPLLVADQGLAAPLFDGTNDTLAGNAASLNLTRNLPGFTCFHVCRYSSAPDVTRRMVFATQTGVGNARTTQEKDAADHYLSGNRRLDADASSSNGSTVVVPATRLVQVVRYMYTATTMTQWANGVLVANTTAFQTAGNTSDTDSTATAVGSVAGSAPFMLGTIFAILAYQRALLDWEKLLVTRYLGERYAVAVTNG
jgi:hypothetical protein